MYQTYFGIEENPFSLTPDPRYLYMAKGHQEALAHLLYGVSEGGGFVLLTGEVGTGKTSICRALLEQLPDEAEVALILNPKLSEFELLATICDELGVDQPRTSSLKELVDGLNRALLELHAAGRRAVLILDEAQNLSPSVLEQLRLLTNLETAKHKLLQIILIGQPELLDILSRKELRQLAQRITARYHLEPLNALDAKAYIAHRLKVAGLPDKTFSPAARSEVYKRSRGVPRLINSLCDRCLLAAYVQETRRIDQRMVRDAAGEVFGQHMPVRARRRVLVPGALAMAATAFAAVVLIEPREIAMPEVTPGAAPGAETAATGLAEAGALFQLDFLSSAIDEVVLADIKRPAATFDVASGDTDLAVLPAAQGSSQALPEAIGEQAPAAVERALPVPGAALQTAAAAPQPDPRATDRKIQPLQPEAGQTAAAAAPGNAPANAGENAPGNAGEPVLPALSSGARGETPGLSDLLAGGVDEEVALGQLFALWGRDYRLLAGRDACEKALWAGLRCLSGRADLAYLKAIDRPALLSLVAPNGHRVPAVLSATDGRLLVLSLGDREIRTEAAEMTAVWTGDYLLLWQPPEVYQRYLKRGDQGRDVAWLKRRLAEVGGYAAEIDLEALFDESLEARVVAFQRRRGLTADGVVGPRTFIELNNIAAASDETAFVVAP